MVRIFYCIVHTVRTIDESLWVLYKFGTGQLVYTMGSGVAEVLWQLRTFTKGNPNYQTFTIKCLILYKSTRNWFRTTIPNKIDYFILFISIYSFTSVFVVVVYFPSRVEEVACAKEKNKHTKCLVEKEVLHSQLWC